MRKSPLVGPGYIDKLCSGQYLYIKGIRIKVNKK